MKVKPYNKEEEVAEFKKFAHGLGWCYQYLRAYIKYGECIIEEKDPTRTSYNIEAVKAKVEAGYALISAFSEFMESYQSMGKQFILDVDKFTEHCRTKTWEEATNDLNNID